MSSNADAGLTAYIAELHRAVHAIGLFLDERLEGRVSQSKALLLLHLSTLGDLSVNALHQAFLHRRSTLTSVLDRLESKGLVQRTASAMDRRSVEVSLTVQGARLAAKIAHAIDALAGELAPSLAVGARDVARLRRLAETAAKLAAADDR